MDKEGEEKVEREDPTPSPLNLHPVSESILRFELYAVLGTRAKVGLQN